MKNLLVHEASLYLHFCCPLPHRLQNSKPPPLQDSGGTGNLQSEWFSHSYLKPSHRIASAMSEDEEEEVESRFRGTPNAVTNITADQSTGLAEKPYQPSRFAVLKTQDNEEASYTPAAQRKLFLPSETPDSTQIPSRAFGQNMESHSKNAPNNWLDSLRHRKRSCPFDNDKDKQLASLPSNLKKTPQIANPKRQQQIQIILHPNFYTATPSKDCQKPETHPEEKCNANPRNDHRHQALPQEMEDCKLNAPQMTNQRSAVLSQQNALAILMTGKVDT